MDREVIFANSLQSLVKQARAQGNIVSEEEIQNAFAELAKAGMPLDKGQLELIKDYLKKHNIGIGQPVAEEDYLDQEEIDYLEMYMKDLSELPEYSEGEKEAFTLSAMAGEVDAQNKLIQIFLPDVVEIAKLYAGQGVYLEDLIGEGNVALTMGVTMLGALEHASEAQGTLAKLIMDGMEEYIAECVDNTKTDDKIADKVNIVADKANELFEDLRRKITVEELAQETGMSRKSILDAIRLSGNSIDTIDAGDIDG